MGCSMRLDMSQQKLQLNELDITGGVSISVFRQSESMLNQSKYQEALFNATRKKSAAGNYHSIMDFLFAELAGDYWKRKCMKFYDGAGPAIKDDPEADTIFIAKWDVVLCLALQISLQIVEEERHQQWGWCTVATKARAAYKELNL